MRKLGLLTDHESITDEARQAYAKLFDSPLSRPQLAALAALFGWEIPADCEKGPLPRLQALEERRVGEDSLGV